MNKRLSNDVKELQAEVYRLKTQLAVAMTTAESSHNMPASDMRKALFAGQAYFIKATLPVAIQHVRVAIQDSMNFAMGTLNFHESRCTEEKGEPRRTIKVVRENDNTKIDIGYNHKFSIAETTIEAEAKTLLLLIWAAASRAVDDVPYKTEPMEGT